VEYRVPVERALTLHYRGTRREKAVSVSDDDATRATEKLNGLESRAATLAWIAAELVRGDAIDQALMQWRRKENPNEASISPRTAAERQVAAIWAETLGVEDVGVNDNFFQLGGDSLAMVRIILRVHELTGFELPIRAFFEAPTIEEQVRDFPIDTSNV
jgi:acyl carrier protein